MCIVGCADTLVTIKTNSIKMIDEPMFAMRYLLLNLTHLHLPSSSSGCFQRYQPKLGY